MRHVDKTLSPYCPGCGLVDPTGSSHSDICHRRLASAIGFSKEMTRFKITKQKGAVWGSVRAIRSVFVALLIILQSLAPLAAAGASSVGINGHTKTSPLFPSLICWGQEDHGHVPKPEHGYAKCCILCSVRDLESAAALILPNDSTATSPRVTQIRVARPDLLTARITRLGWTGAWSSRAPPLFS